MTNEFVDTIISSSQISFNLLLMNSLKKYLLLLFLLSPTLSFTQNDTCYYTIQLVDFFGDGWDGAELTVVTDDNSTTYTLPDSSIISYQIPVKRNERLKFFYSSGLYDEEVSYLIMGPQGNLIFNDGPFPKEGLVVDLIACPSCPTPTNLQVNTSAEFAIANWSKSENAYNYLIEYGPKGFELGTGMELSTSDTIINISDLNPFIQYDIYLSAICLMEDTTLSVLDTSLTKTKAAFTTRYHKDVGITAVNMPNSGCGLSDAEKVTVTLKNYGGNPQTLIPFFFNVNGIDAGVMTPTDGFYTNILSKDSTAIFTFETSYDFSAAGEYNIAVWTALSGDEQISNDTAYLSIRNSPSIQQIPYNQTFEIENNWYSNVTDSISWRFGETDNTEITPLGNSPTSWYVTIDSSINQADTIYLNSPCFDFSTLSQDPTFTFQYLLNLNSFGSQFWIEVSTDQGDNWRRLTADETANNWYDDASEIAFVSNTFAWITASNTLSFTARKPEVRIRFVFEGAAGEEEGQKLAIDDINVLPNFSTATNQLDVVNDFRLFPNPSNGLVKLELDLDKTAKVQYQIVDILGRPVFKSITIKGQAIERILDFKNQSKGMYFLRLSVDNQLVTKKIFIGP